MTIGKICNQRVITINETLTIKEATKVMASQSVGFLIVTKASSDSLPAGTITDRDIVVNVIAKDLNVQSTKVSEIMVKNVVTADASQGVYEVIQMMSNNKIRRLPIVDNGQVVGVVALDDLLLVLAKEIGTLAEITQNQIP